MDVKIPLQANSKVEENGKLKNLTISINTYVTDGSKMYITYRREQNVTHPISKALQ